VRFESFSFGSIQIDGVTHEHDLVIDRGQIRKRIGSLRPYATLAKEDIPWRCAAW